MRRRRSRPAGGPPARSSDLLRYGLVWLAGGAVVAGLLVLLIGGGDDEELPPVRFTQLEQAARVARCEFRQARPGENLEPPVDGPRVASPLRPGVYEEPERAESVVAALRAGTIVVHYGKGLEEGRIEQLKDLQLSVPTGTIVLPGEPDMRYELAVTAWHRLLGCTRVSDQAIDAARLFLGRFIGRGPDRRP